MSKIFNISSPFQPKGDQPQAIKDLERGFKAGARNQVLVGVTGSGKTFTMAHLINSLGVPTIIMAHNKTLAAQLYGEMKSFFPDNAVEYFVSYYDFYQPEAYLPRTDTYIEKQATINQEIDRMRHSATRALLERKDVIVVSSVSCIYGLGSVEAYAKMTLKLSINQSVERKDLLKNLVELLYTRNDIDFSRGAFRVRGDSIYVFPSHYEDRAWRISIFDNIIEEIVEIDSLTGKVILALDHITIYANSHYITPGPTLQQAARQIKIDLNERVTELENLGKKLEAQRLFQRVTFDIETITATGTCSGIENYSRYLSGRAPGEPPPTLFEYMPKESLLIVDESHATIPQLSGMYRGDAVRKRTLYEHGFRLPSCADNRPLKFEEWDRMRPISLFVSATPGPWELEQAEIYVVEQIVRPTGLLDPICIVKPTINQIDDLIDECKQTITKGYRALVTTLTKKMAEALTEYLCESNIKAKYMHSEIKTLERMSILHELREGKFDVLVGINLLREGLDIPECALVAIIDADKEGFLRSKTSLIQTIGRCARNSEGKAILYADTITNSMRDAMNETKRRRRKQEQYNTLHNITPTTIQKELKQILLQIKDNKVEGAKTKFSSIVVNSEKERQVKIRNLEKEMKAAAIELEFEKAAVLRDQLRELQQLDLDILS